MPANTSGQEDRLLARLPHVPEVLCPKTTRWDFSSLDALKRRLGELRPNFPSGESFGPATALGTEVRLGWSGDVLQGLYLCQDPNPWATKQPGTMHYGKRKWSRSS